MVIFFPTALNIKKLSSQSVSKELLHVSNWFLLLLCTQISRAWSGSCSSLSWTSWASPSRGQSSHLNTCLVCWRRPQTHRYEGKEKLNTGLVGKEEDANSVVCCVSMRVGEIHQCGGVGQSSSTVVSCLGSLLVHINALLNLIMACMACKYALELVLGS